MFVGQRIVRNRKKQWLVGSTVSKLCLAKVNRRKKEYKKSSCKEKQLVFQSLKYRSLEKQRVMTKKKLRKVVRYVKKDLTRMLNDTAKSLRRVFVSSIHLLRTQISLCAFSGIFLGLVGTSILDSALYPIFEIHEAKVNKSSVRLLGLSNTLPMVE